LGKGSFTSNGASLTISNSENFNFGTGDFTIEAFVYMDTYDTNYRNVISIDYTSAYFRFQFQNAGYGNQFAFVPQSSVFAGNFLTTSYRNNGMWMNNWNHLAFTRYKGYFMCFINGIMVPTGDFQGGLYYLVRSYPVNYVGSTSLVVSASSEPWQGYIDEVRVTKGVARYTGNFIVPQVSLPNC
jgi:hypothetical protein